MRNLRFCPKCRRLGVENDPLTGTERCLRNDCNWINTTKEYIAPENMDSSTDAEFSRNLRKFIKITEGAVL